LLRQGCSKIFSFVNIAAIRYGQTCEKYLKEKSGAENATERHSGL